MENSHSLIWISIFAFWVFVFVAMGHLVAPWNCKMSFLCVLDLLCLCALHATFTIAFVDCDFELTY